MIVRTLGTALAFVVLCAFVAGCGGEEKGTGYIGGKAAKDSKAKDSKAKDK